MSDPTPSDRLPTGSVYRSPAGRAEIADYCRRALERLAIPHRTEELATSFGRTHLTIAGRMDGEPLLVLPGMSIPGALMVGFFERQGRDRLLISPDLIGHPGLSEDRVHSPAGHGFGRWLGELLDGLGLARADILSGSFGSSFALDLCAIAPARVRRQALVVPAGLTPSLPYAGIVRHFGWNWLRYRYWPDRRRLAAVAAPLAGALGAHEMDFLDIVVRETAFWRHRPAGPFLPGDLDQYRTPVLMVTAGRDVLFPYAATRANAAATLNVGQEIHLPESRHMPDPARMDAIQERIAAFLAG